MYYFSPSAQPPAQFIPKRHGHTLTPDQLTQHLAMSQPTTGAPPPSTHHPQPRSVAHPPPTSSSTKPHALQSFSTIASALSGRAVSIFLDYDGTLTPIVSDPSAARISAAMTDTIATLSAHHPTAIVTGRKIDTIRGFLDLPALYYAGSHGFDIRGPGGVKVKQVADEYLGELGEVRDAVREGVKGVKGSLVEDNVYSISVHYRNADEEGRKVIEEVVHRAFAGHEDRLQLLPGKMVHEIRPQIEWHKGEAVQYLLGIMQKEGQAQGGAEGGRAGKAAVCMGDDTTDEDAFRVLEADPNSVTVLVLPEGGGERQTNAKYVCQQPEVGEFLSRLAKL